MLGSVLWTILARKRSVKAASFDLLCQIMNAFVCGVHVTSDPPSNTPHATSEGIVESEAPILRHLRGCLPAFSAMTLGHRRIIRPV